MPSPSPAASVSPTPQIKAFDQMMLDSYTLMPGVFVTLFLVLAIGLFVAGAIILIRLSFHHGNRINQPFESFGLFGLSMAEKKNEANNEPLAAEQVMSALKEQQKDMDDAMVVIRQLKQQLEEQLQKRKQLDAALMNSFQITFNQIGQLSSDTNESFAYIEHALKQLESNVVERKAHMQAITELKEVDSDNSAKAQENQQAIKHLQDQQMELRAALNELRKSIQEP